MQNLLALADRDDIEPVIIAQMPATRHFMTPSAEADGDLLYAQCTSKSMWA